MAGLLGTAALPRLARADEPPIPPEGIGNRIRHLSYSDQGGRPDGVQVMLNRGHVYVGHMFSNGITVLDAADPRNLKPVLFWTAGDETRTHHIQVAEDMLPPSSSNSSEIYTPRTRKVGYGVAAAAMLPAIFVQVPSGLAVSGSLISGITSADQIVHNTTGTTTDLQADGTVNSAAFSVGYSVIQVAIGITVGLFLSALVIYPFGKKRSGLFSF